MIIQVDGGGGGGGGPRNPPPTGGGGSGPPPSPVPTIPVLLDISAQLIADVIKGGLTETAPVKTIQDFFNECRSVSIHMGLLWSVASGSTNLQAAQTIRAAVMAALSRASAVVVIAASRGFLLPDDPMPRFTQINETRQLFGSLGISAGEEKELLSNTVDLVSVAIAFDAGVVTFLQHQPAEQLASFEVSLDGISQQSGDPLVDVLGYQPDADFIKRKQALDSLAKLDFSRRKPYLLFTADFITAGRRASGTAICWVKMRDASGYVVTKRNVFTGAASVPISLSAEQVQTSTDSLIADPSFSQVLSFYDWVHPGDSVAFLDPSNEPGALYSYSIAGVQRRAPASQFVFDVPMSSLYLTTAQADTVRATILQGMPIDVDSVSPYPALAQVVYGDPGYGWILAGCNVLASKRRGDASDDTRSLSYIGSKASVVLAQAAAGRLFVPTDVNQIHSAIDSGVTSYGVSQVILSVLDGTGVTLFSSQKDDPLGFQPTQESLQGVTGGLAKILGAIDPESATLDPNVLATALTTHVGSGGQARYSSTPVMTNAQGMPSAQNSINSSTLSTAFGDGVIDLTVYSGISRLMQLIRIIYDFYPGALV